MSPFGRFSTLAPLFASLLTVAAANAQTEPAVVAPTPVAPPPVAPVAPTADAPPIVSGSHTCFVGEHDGLEAADTRTAASLVCGELNAANAPAGAYDVRFGKLGSRILLVVGSRATRAERSLLIQSYDELPTAGPRVVDALVHGTSIETTQTTENVIAAEARAPEKRPVSSGAYLGLIGMGGVGTTSGFSSGVDLGLMFRKERFEFGGHFRSGGIGSGDDKLGFVGLDLGLHYYLSDGDIAPYVGGGLGFSYLQANHVFSEADGSGFGAYAEAGLGLLRTSRVGPTISLRADAPFYVLKEGPEYSWNGVTQPRASTYVVPISLNFGIAFH